MIGQRELEHLAKRALAEIDSDFGYHPGYRAAQAKGTVCHGRFVSTGKAANLTKAAHMQPGAVTPVTVRFSNSATNPMRRDGALDVRGMSVAFHLERGDRTDIIALRMGRFLVGTAHGFLAFERAITRNRLPGADLPCPTWRAFLYPVINRLPKTMLCRQVGPLCRIPTYARCRYNALHAFRWIDAGGGRRHVRYSWMPKAGEAKFPKFAWWRTRRRHRDYLREELAKRIAEEPVSFRLEVKIAGPGDRVDDASAKWGKGRERVHVGTLEVTGMGPTDELGDQQLAFDPTRITDGIELPDGDDLLLLRKHVYALSARRRSGIRDQSAGCPGGGPPTRDPEDRPDLPDRDPEPGAPKTVRVKTGMDICYRTSGDPAGRPLLLIMGFACPMTWWREDFCDMFVKRGFYVIRFDNRDCGRSSRVGGKQNPLLGLLFPRRIAPYDVNDMADDVAGLLDALGVRAAHVMGISLGGMIGQALAINHGHRVSSLASLASTPRFRLFGLRPRYWPDPRVLLQMLKRPGKTLPKHITKSLRLWRLLNGSHFPFEEQNVREHIARAWDWSGGPDQRADARQVLAVRAAEDRTVGLRALRHPAVVIHGTDDPLVRIAGGVDTCHAIRGAKLVKIEGMGHYTPKSTWAQIIDEVDEVARVAEGRAVAPPRPGR